MVTLIPQIKKYSGLVLLGAFLICVFTAPPAGLKTNGFFFGALLALLLGFALFYGNNPSGELILPRWRNKAKLAVQLALFVLITVAVLCYFLTPQHRPLQVLLHTLLLCCGLAYGMFTAALVHDSWPHPRFTLLNRLLLAVLLAVALLGPMAIAQSAVHSSYLLEFDGGVVAGLFLNIILWWLPPSIFSLRHLPRAARIKAALLAGIPLTYAFLLTACTYLAGIEEKGTLWQQLLNNFSQALGVVTGIWLFARVQQLLQKRGIEA